MRSRGADCCETESVRMAGRTACRGVSGLQEVCVRTGATGATAAACAGAGAGAGSSASDNSQCALAGRSRASFFIRRTDFACSTARSPDEGGLPASAHHFELYEIRVEESSTYCTLYLSVRTWQMISE